MNEENKGPIILKLEAGTYYWCSCGKSASQPFCDGSHAGSESEPVAFEVTKTRNVALCGCKRTHKQPFCDGTHAKPE